MVQFQFAYVGLFGSFNQRLGLSRLIFIDCFCDCSPKVSGNMFYFELLESPVCMLKRDVVRMQMHCVVSTGYGVLRDIIIRVRFCI